MRKLVALLLVILLTFGFAVVSDAESTNTHKALPALTAAFINEVWPEVKDWDWASFDFTKGSVQSTIVLALNEYKHEYGYEKLPYDDKQVEEAVWHIGFGFGDPDD